MERMISPFEQGYRLLFWILASVTIAALLFGRAGLFGQFRHLGLGEVALLPLPFAVVAVKLVSEMLARGTAHPMRTARRFLRLQRAWLLRSLICCVYCLVLFWAVIALKNAIPKIVPFYADPHLAAADQWIFGTDPWRITHRWFGPAGTLMLDRLYQVWFVELGVLILWISFSRDRRFQLSGMLAFALTWILLGNVLATAFASVGPWDFHAQFHGDRFDQLMAQLKAYDTAFDIKSFTTMSFLLTSQQDPRLGSGISAMPSMHVAIATLAVMMCLNANRMLVPAAGIFLIVIAIGSVHLGWHYAMDSIVSIIGTWLIWLWSVWYVSRLSAQPLPPAEISQ